MYIETSFTPLMLSIIKLTVQSRNKGYYRVQNVSALEFTKNMLTTTLQV